MGATLQSEGLVDERTNIKTNQTRKSCVSVDGDKIKQLDEKSTKRVERFICFFGQKDKDVFVSEATKTASGCCFGSFSRHRLNKEKNVQLALRPSSKRENFFIILSE